MSTIVAFPSDAPGGTEAALSAHFGHCAVFTLVTLTADGTVDTIKIVDNLEHEHGGCMGPVNLLAGHGVTALIAGGMGQRPLLAFAQVGIAVHHGADSVTVDHALAAFRAGRLIKFDPRQTCGGH